MFLVVCCFGVCCFLFFCLLFGFGCFLFGFYSGAGDLLLVFALVFYKPPKSRTL